MPGSNPFNSMRASHRSNLSHWFLTGLVVLALSACGGSRVKPGDSGSTSPELPDIDLPAFKERVVPEDAAADWQLANELMEQKSWSRARQAMTSLHQRFPNFSGPLLSLALIDWKTGAQEGKAARVQPLVEQAIERHPRNPSAYNLLGAVHRSAGKFKEAETAYQNALTANPKFGPAMLNLGILYDLYLGNKAKALELYRRYQSQREEREEPVDNQVRLWIADLERQLK